MTQRKANAARRHRKTRRTVARQSHPVPPMPDPPRGRRWLTETKEAWDGWWSGGHGAGWTAFEVQSAFRLLVLTDDFHRAETPEQRSALAGEVDKRSRALRLHLPAPDSEPLWSTRPAAESEVTAIKRRAHLHEMRDREHSLEIIAAAQREIQALDPDALWPACAAELAEIECREAEGQVFEQPPSTRKRDAEGAGGRWTRRAWDRAFPDVPFPADDYEDPARKFEDGSVLDALFSA